MSAIAVAVSCAHDELRDVYGRGMNLKSDVYRLPADKKEHDRLTLQHQLWKYAFGQEPGLYPPATESRVQKLLSPSLGKRPSVLDVGTGSGIWAIEMAAMFPQVQVIGLDLAMPQIKINLPNCSFVISDVMETDLEEYDNSFDIVHSRCVIGHVIEKETFILRLAKLLKPGGLLLLADGNKSIYTPTGEVLPPADPSSIDEGNESSIPADTVPTPSDSSAVSTSCVSSSPLSNSRDLPPSWLAFWLHKAVSSMPGGKLVKHDVGTLLHKFEFGDGYSADAEARNVVINGNIKLFRECCYETYFMPGVFTENSLSEYGEGEREKEVAKLCARNMQYFLESSTPTILANGVPQHKVEAWSARAHAELHEGRVPWCFKWDMAWATKV